MIRVLTVIHTVTHSLIQSFNKYFCYAPDMCSILEIWTQFKQVPPSPPRA